MCIVKSINGRTNLAKARDYLYYGRGGVRAYFVGKGGDRCLGKDFLNLGTQYSIDHWDEVMDDTRRVNGNDKPIGRRKAVTYRHYIISPNPQDDCDLKTLRKLVLTWAERNFGSDGKFGTYQCAFFYHNDNSERAEKGLPGIPHAHLIINNTDLKTGKRMHIDKKEWHDLYFGLEDIARELGLSYFSFDKTVDENGKVIYETSRHVAKADKNEEISAYYRRAPIDKDKPRKYDHRPSSQEIYRTKTEREILAKGQTSWKDELRDCIDIACNISRDMAEFRANLEKMGVVTTERASKRANGNDLIFYYPQPGVEIKDNKKRVGGSKLGRQYTNGAIEGKMKLAYYRRLDSNDRDEPRLIDLVSEINTIKIHDTSKVTLKDVSRAFAAINGANLQTVEEAKQLLSQYKKLVGGRYDDPTYKNSVEQIKNIEALLRVAEVSNILPPNQHWAATPPKDAERRREMARCGGKAPLSHKVDRGWPLSKEEEQGLRRTSPGDYYRWKRNFTLASAGRTSELRAGSGAGGPRTGSPSNARGSLSASGATRERVRGR